MEEEAVSSPEEDSGAKDITAEKPVTEERPDAEPDAVSLSDENTQDNGCSDGETPKEILAEESPDEKRIAALLASPMFAHFARGKKQGFDELCRDFEAMLAAGGFTGARISAETRAKMTPPCDSTAVSPEAALSERQREIARAAGMPYREYYELIRGIPHKKEDFK